MEKLKELIGEELYTQVVAKLGDKKLFVGEGEFIPKSRLDEKIAEVAKAKEQLADRDKQLSDIGEKAKGNEELTKQLAEIKALNESEKLEYENKLSQAKRNYAIDSALKGAGAKNTKALMALLDQEQIKIEEDKVVGIEEQLTKLKESDSYLFNIEPAPTPPAKGGLKPTNPQATDEFAAFQKL